MNSNLKETKYPGYFAGVDGVIYSTRTNAGFYKKSPTALKPGVGSSPYFQVNVPRDGKRKSTLVHFIVCETYHGPRPEGMTASHVNGDNFDNRPDNLV